MPSRDRIRSEQGPAAPEPARKGKANAVTPVRSRVGAWRNRIVGEGQEAPAKLLPNPLNFRVHPALQERALTGALDSIGWIQRVVVNRRTGHVVDGHLRVQLAMRAGAKEIPVVYVDLSPAEERLALATIDPITGLAETDRTVLADLIGQLDRTNVDLQPLLDDLARQAKGAAEQVQSGAGDPDAVPPRPRTAVSRAGDIWNLGEHRLVVGDALKAESYTALLGKEQADMVWTDPPYNVAYEGAAGAIENDDMSREAFVTFLRRAFERTSVSLKPGGAFYVAHADTTRREFLEALDGTDLKVSQFLVWVKNSAPLSRHDYNWRHEPILYGWREGAAHYFGFDFTETTVVDETAELGKLSRKALEALCATLLQRPATTVHYHDRPARSELHPTMKPVALVSRQLANSSRRGEIVLDPFAGSGTTLIAAATIARRARLIELDPTFADVIIERWQQWSAGEAEHADGLTFAQVTQKRRRRKVA